MHVINPTCAADLKPHQREAIRVLGAYTANRFDPWILMGNAKASCRAHVMALLKDVPKFPQSQSGVNALRDALFALANVHGDCLASQEDAFVEWARSL